MAQRASLRPPGEPDEVDEMLAEQMKDPRLAAAYEDAQARHELYRDLIDVRKTNWLSVDEVAERMEVKRKRVIEFESGATDPCHSFLQRYARAVGVRLKSELAGPPAPPGQSDPTVPAAVPAHRDAADAIAADVDRIARAIGDPGSIVGPRHYSAGETVTRWSTRAVLQVIAEHLQSAEHTPASPVKEPRR